MDEDKQIQSPMGRPLSHGMHKFKMSGPDYLNERQKKRRGYLSDLIATSEGRQEIYHETTVPLSLIIFEAYEYLLREGPDQAVSQLMNSNMRLLKNFLDGYPEDSEEKDAIELALQEAERQNWSIPK